MESAATKLRARPSEECTCAQQPASEEPTRRFSGPPITSSGSLPEISTSGPFCGPSQHATNAVPR